MSQKPKTSKEIEEQIENLIRYLEHKKARYQILSLDVDAFIERQKARLRALKAEKEL